MTEIIRVQTPVGTGLLWGIAPGKVLVEMDYTYLVEFDLGQVERVEE